MPEPIKTTCPYCGVGCGIVATVDDSGGEVAVSGDKTHPANFGRLCSKGAALGDTLSLDGRLLYPQCDEKRVSWDTAIETVSKRFTDIIAKHGADSVAFYVSGQLLTEDYYVANKLLKGFIGTANIDTNSRLCMASSVAGHKRAFGTDTVPCSYEDLECAKLIVLVGSNTAWCHPVLFQRIKKAKQQNGDVTVVVIDPRRTSSCDIADVHLPIRPGSDTVLFNGLLSYLHDSDNQNAIFVNNCTEGLEDALQAAKQCATNLSAVSQQCGLTEQQLQTFYKLFADNERVVTVYSQGVNQSSSGTDKVNSILNCHLLTGRIGRPGMGPFSFTGQPNAMGGREVGGLANQLAAHMEIENSQHRSWVQEFWESPTISATAGLKAVDMFEAMKQGKIKAVWIMATNPVVSLPDSEQVKAALKQCEFVVVSDCVQHTDTTEFAHVLLPASAWGEKAGTVTNSERRISRQRAFLSPPGEAKPDWWIMCEVAKKMGFASAFTYENVTEIFREHARLSGYHNQGSRDFDISAMADMGDDAYDDFPPIQWPVINSSNAQNNWLGKARMFSDGVFFTDNKKARFVAITPRLPVNSTSEDYPLILNTGRVRDQWHTMTRTGKASNLSEHSPEPFAEMHSLDAQKFNINAEELVKIVSRWGEAVVRVKINDDYRQGSVFAPMHWNNQFASQGRIGAVVNPELDPISGQPEFKHTPVKVIAYRPAWHGFLLSRRELQLQEASYWVKTKGKHFHRYELAGEFAPHDWPQWARKYLCASDNDVNWVEYLDVAKRRYRGVRLIGKRLESCIFIAPTHELPPRSWLASLFNKDAIGDQERVSLLTGKPPAGQKDFGKTICACFGVGEKTILEAIEKDGLSSVEEIGARLNAGTNCGSCIPELQGLLQQLNQTVA